MLTAGEAAAIGLVDTVVPYEELDATIARAIESSGEPRKRPELDTRHEKLEALFRDNSADDLRTGRADAGSDEALAKLVKRIGFKACLEKPLKC